MISEKISYYGYGIHQLHTEWLSRLVTNVGERYDLRWLGTMGIFLILFVAILGILTLLFALSIEVSDPTASEVNDPRSMILIPGMNPFIPLAAIGYIFVTLLFAIVAHEAAHGIVFVNEGVGIEDAGFLFFCGIPIGAYVAPEVEPEEMETWTLFRGVAAAPMMNAILAVIALPFIFVTDPVSAFYSYFHIMDGIPAPTEPVGWESHLVFWHIFLNVNLVLANSLPVPTLDGGHIAKRLFSKLGLQRATTYLGIALLGILILFISYPHLYNLV